MGIMAIIGYYYHNGYYYHGNPMGIPFPLGIPFPWSSLITTRLKAGRRPNGPQYGPCSSVSVSVPYGVITRKIEAAKKWRESSLEQE